MFSVFYFLPFVRREVDAVNVKCGEELSLDVGAAER